MVLLQQTQVSPIAWAAFALSLGTFALLLFDRITGRGKSIAKIDAKLDTLCSEVEDFAEAAKILDTRFSSIDEKLQSLTNEIRGFDGDNGLRSAVRQHASEIRGIKERNTKMDALAEVLKDDLHYRGQEKREAMRKAREKLEHDPE